MRPGKGKRQMDRLPFLDVNLTGRTNWMKAIFSFLLGFLLYSEAFSTPEIIPFGKNGKFKMLYDVRQRPQSVLIKDNLFIVYNGDASPTKDDKGKAYPMLISYDPDNGFSRNPSGFRKQANRITTTAPSSGRTRTITCTSSMVVTERPEPTSSPNGPSGNKPTQSLGRRCPPSPPSFPTRPSTGFTGTRR